MTDAEKMIAAGTALDRPVQMGANSAYDITFDIPTPFNPNTGSGSGGLYRPLWDLAPGESGLIAPHNIYLDYSGFAWVQQDAIVLADNKLPPSVGTLRLVRTATGVKMYAHVTQPRAMPLGVDLFPVSVG